jgi:tetratricopeptide (TPR) repeat protein
VLGSRQARRHSEAKRGALLEALVNPEPTFPAPRRYTVAAALALTLLGPIAAVFAAGSGPSAPTTTGMSTTGPTMTPQQQAASRYNHGLKLQAKGDDAEKQAASATDEKKRAKAVEAAQKAWEKAGREYEHAIALDPQHHQAHGALGYILRKQGKLDASLASYDRALQIKPGFTPAIEYRAEAYLGLGRIEEAKADYITLFATDRKNADTLAAAMTKWLEDRKKDPKGVDPAVLDDLTKWLESRQEIAAKTSALLPPKDARW